MYDLVMGLAAAGFFTSIGLLAVVVVRVFKRKPLKKYLVGMTLSFVGAIVLANVAGSTEEGVRLEQRQKEAYALANEAGPIPAPISTVLHPSATDSASPEARAAVAELGNLLSQKLDAADAAIAKTKWEAAATLLSEVRAIGEAAPESARSHDQILALGRREAELRAKIAEFDGRLFEALFQRVTVDEVKEPGGLTPAAAVDWDKREEERRTREVAKKFGVTVEYADRVFQEGPIVERTKKEAELQRIRDEAQRTALAQKCGADVGTSLSGAPIAVDDYLDETLDDPDSKKNIECGAPSLTNEHCWVVKCKYRAKNVFGAYMLSGKMFYISHNRVMHAESL